MVSPGDQGKVVLRFDEGELSFQTYDAVRRHYREQVAEHDRSKREFVRLRVYIGCGIIATRKAMGWGSYRRIYTDFGLSVRVGQAVVRIAEWLAGPDGRMCDEKYEQASIYVGVKGDASFSQLDRGLRTPNAGRNAQRAAHLNPPQSPPEVGHGGTLSESGDDFDPFEAGVDPDEILNSGGEPGPPSGSPARFDVAPWAGVGGGDPLLPPTPASPPGASGEQLTFEGMFTRAQTAMQRFRDAVEGGGALDPLTQRMALMRAEQFAIDIEDLLNQAAGAG